MEERSAFSVLEIPSVEERVVVSPTWLPMAWTALEEQDAATLAWQVLGMPAVEKEMHLSQLSTPGIGQLWGVSTWKRGYSLPGFVLKNLSGPQ